MPMGSENCGTGRESGRTALIFSMRKPLYLKMPSSYRLMVTAKISAGLSPAGSGEPFHQQTAEPHHESRSEQQQNPDRFTPGIEQERHRHQYKIPYRIAAGGIVEDQVDRQEYIEEKQIGKYHIRNAPLTDLCRKSHGLSRGKYRFYFITNPREIKAFCPQLQRKIPFYHSLLLQ